MHVKIIKAPSGIWYENKLGKVFEIETDVGITRNRLKYGSYCVAVDMPLYIRIEDCEVCEKPEALTAETEKQKFNNY